MEFIETEMFIHLYCGSIPSRTTFQKTACRTEDVDIVMGWDIQGADFARRRG